LTPTKASLDPATPVLAQLLVAGAGLLVSFLDTGAKYLVLSGMAAPFVSWMRFAVHVVLVLVLLRGWSNAATFRPVSLPRQVLRGVFLFGSTLFNFLALNTLQLAETTSIAFFAPMVITALAGPLLGEWAGWRRWAAVLAGFAGVLVITRPGLGLFGIGHAYALAATFSYCFYVIMTRHMAGTETAETLIFYSALAPVVLMLPVLPYTASAPPDLFHLAVLLSLGVFGAFGHWLLIKAYRMASATSLAPYAYLQMLWMIGLGYLFFDQFPDGWTLGGAAIIVAGGLYIVHREHRLRLRSRTAPNTENGELAKKL
jgi:drug/metabolite transporter (DMT)-like permease